MTATDDLRRLLNECGVEHVDGESMTYTNDADFIPAAGGTFDVTLYERTTEQAIEAMLGRGTCHRVMYKPTKTLVCSECGAGMPRQLDRYCYLHYCPNCGRKVTDG